MNNFIIGVLEFGCGLVLFGLVLIGAIVGNRFLGGAGWLVGAAGGFVSFCVVFGPFFVLLRIDKNIAALRGHFVAPQVVRPEQSKVFRPFLRLGVFRTFLLLALIVIVGAYALALFADHMGH